jgi:drug/metabolite transporter (DMT)-like permease
MGQYAAEKKWTGQGYFCVAIAASGWGLWPLILTHANVSILLQASIALAVPTLVTAPLSYSQRYKRPTPKQKFALIVFGISDACGLLCFFGALRLTTVAIAVLTHYLSTVLIPLTAIVLRLESPKRRAAVAICVSLSGLTLLLSPWHSTPQAHDLIGAALGAASAVFGTANILVTKQLSATLAPVQLMFYHGLSALPPLLITTLLIPGATNTSIPGLAILTLGALGPGTIGVMIFFSGLKQIPATHTAVLTLLEPVVAIIIAILFMNQPPDLFTLTGAAAVLAGAALVIEPTKGSNAATIQLTPSPDSLS